MLTNLRLYDCMRGNLLYLFGINSEIIDFQKKSGFKIFSEQMKMLLALKNNTNKWNIIRAPMGSGKTATMIMTALECEGKTVFLINTRIYTTWIQEFKNFGMKLVQDPAASDIIIVHTKYPKHRDTFTGKCNYGKIDDKKIVVTTPYYFRRYSLNFRKWISDGVKTGCLIMDEAHLMKNNDLYFFHMFTDVRRYLFSASPMNINTMLYGSYPIFEYEIFRYTVKSIGSKGYPKLSFKRLTIQDNYINSMIKAIKKTKYKKIVIFTSIALKDLRRYAVQMKKDLPGWIVLTFSNTAPTILARWKKAKKGVLLCNYQTSSEGTNFSETDCAFFYHFECVSLEKARQSMGRIRRKNNLHSTVRIIFFEESDDIAWVKGRLNQQYAMHLKKGIFYKKDKNTIYHIILALKKDRLNVMELSDEDILAIFSCNHKIKPTIRLKALTLPLVDIIGYTQM